MKVRFVKKYTVAVAQKSPEDIFVFGDNLEGWGKSVKAGQAVIREQPNAFGVPTKRKPKTTKDAYFSDQSDELEAVTEALRKLYVLGKTKTLVFPQDGLGTGRAKMKELSPKIYARMNEILKNHFGVDFSETEKDDSPAP